MAYASQTSLRYWWSPACSGPWVTISLHGAGKVTVRPAVKDAVKALNQVLVAYNYRTRAADTGAYNCRQVTGGSRYSLHAYAIAIDINWQSNPYGRTLRTDMFRYGDGRMPHAIEAIRTNNGKQVWRWGGWFSGNKDAMHYEVTCSPGDLATGIRWSTVRGSLAGLPAPKPPTPKPPTPTGDLVYRIHWFKSPQGKTHAYRTISAKTELNGNYLVFEAWHIANPEELKLWQARGLKQGNKSSSPAVPRASIEFHGGEYDNTKTY